MSRLRQMMVVYLRPHADIKGCQILYLYRSDGFTKLRSALTLILNAQLAVAALAATECHYHAGTQILSRPTTLRPVTFNGVAIGTTELNRTAEPDAFHSLTDGNHFFYEDWYLSNPSSSGPVWEYLPTRRNASSPQMAKRQSGEIKVYLDHKSTPYLDGAFVDVVDTLEDLPFTVQEVNWVMSGVGEIFMDIFGDGPFVTSSTSLIGDLVDIFCSALEIFA
ncbi:hypothetical protein ZTR_10766 [Talaromyces verruculosus]|nr:hypothetical protein ZTR_10766 [Talaromyces verruculosus]